MRDEPLPRFAGEDMPPRPQERPAAPAATVESRR
jgi:hypothetical protein